MIRTIFRTGTVASSIVVAGALAGAGQQVLANGLRGSAEGGPVLAIGSEGQTFARRVDLSIGRSLIVDLPRDAKEVFVANPKVANAVVRSTRKVFVIGVDNGATSIFVMDADGKQIATLEVNVGRDLNILIQTLHTALPQANVEVRPAGDSILLTGSVASASEAQQAVDIANAFVGLSGEGGVASRGAVINALTIRGKDQVMLQVRVVEVARTVLKQFGINSSGSWSTFDCGEHQSFSRHAERQSRQLADGEHQPRRLLGERNAAGLRARRRIARPCRADAYRHLGRNRRSLRPAARSRSRRARIAAMSAGSGAARSASSTSPTA